jgi:uncharacterized CHY-type Zn-finger protein
MVSSFINFSQHKYARGKGDINLLCGNCGAVLVQARAYLSIHCPICDSFNNVP